MRIQPVLVLLLLLLVGLVTACSSSPETVDDDQTNGGCEIASCNDPNYCGMPTCATGDVLCGEGEMCAGSPCGQCVPVPGCGETCASGGVACEEGEECLEPAEGCAECVATLPCEVETCEDDPSMCEMGSRCVRPPGVSCAFCELDDADQGHRIPRGEGDSAMCGSAQCDCGEGGGADCETPCLRTEWPALQYCGGAAPGERRCAECEPGYVCPFPGYAFGPEEEGGRCVLACSDASTCSGMDVTCEEGACMPKRCERDDECEGYCVAGRCSVAPGYCDPLCGMHP